MFILKGRCQGLSEDQNILELDGSNLFILLRGTWDSERPSDCRNYTAWNCSEPRIGCWALCLTSCNGDRDDRKSWFVIISKKQNHQSRFPSHLVSQAGLTLHFLLISAFPSGCFTSDLSWGKLAGTRPAPPRKMRDRLGSAKFKCWGKTPKA